MPTLRHHTGNLLLNTLSPDTLEHAGIRAQDQRLADVLNVADRTPEFVHFPHTGAVVSIVRVTMSGQMIESGIVGNEGMEHVKTMLTAPAPTGSRSIVQHEGTFSRLESGKVRELFDKHDSFRAAVLAYIAVFLDQVTQNLVCNRLHTIEQRLAKWLLVMRDRVLTDDLHLTQEFLSYMLGVHRPGVSIAVNALKSEGLISHRRNHIELLDRNATVSRSCECYKPLQEQLRALTAKLS